jgi:hypothetical protein
VRRDLVRLERLARVMTDALWQLSGAITAVVRTA